MNTINDAKVTPLFEIKRVLERVRAEPAYLDRLLHQPEEVAAEFGLDWDVHEIRELWDATYAATKPARTPAVESYLDYVQAMLKLRDKMRSGEAARHPAYQKWRERQKHRVFLELGEARAHSIIHSPLSFELNKGCSVGCWFCGISAPKLSDIWPYTEENALHWRSTLATLGGIVGPLARWGFCYWATDPLDNPDYEKFCSDYHEILGIFPQTTTALSLRDPQRVRRLLQLSESKGCRINRFSILTLKNFLAVQNEYTAKELAQVECIPQNTESVMKYANAGKAHERNQRTDRDGNLVVAKETGTIACVSGFLINMVDGSIRLITPCSATESWPLGYWVVNEGRFSSAGELEKLVLSWLEGLPSSVVQLPRVSLAPFLQVLEEDGGLSITSGFAVVKFTGVHFEKVKKLLHLVQAGEHTAEEIALLNFYSCMVPVAETLTLLERLFDLGCLHEEPAPVA